MELNKKYKKKTKIWIQYARIENSSDTLLQQNQTAYIWLEKTLAPF